MARFLLLPTAGRVSGPADWFDATILFLHCRQKLPGGARPRKDSLCQPNFFSFFSEADGRRLIKLFFTGVQSAMYRRVLAFFHARVYKAGVITKFLTPEGTLDIPRYCIMENYFFFIIHHLGILAYIAQAES